MTWQVMEWSEYGVLVPHNIHLHEKYHFALAFG